MSRIVTYLDCGCAITVDGRSWCPTCASRTESGPMPSPEQKRIAALESALQEADTTIGWLRNIMDTAELRRIAPQVTAKITAAIDAYDRARAATKI